MSNIILNTDSYKVSHFKQYPPNTKYVSSYIESRGGDYDFTLFFGLQMFLNKLKAPTVEEVLEAEEILTSHGFEFNREGWMYIANLGYLPLKIQAVKEGSIIPTHNVLVQVVNTDPKVPWLTSYIETSLLRAVWYPTTVATRSRHIKNTILRYLTETCDAPEAEIGFKLHDFGYRGVSSEESGCIGGCAHLVNFMGTDTLGATLYARRHYGATMAGFSIPAAEHSTITSWGQEHEVDAYRNMITQFGGPGKLVAVVSDSYDIFHAVNSLWGEQLKNEVESFGGTLVVRPDSGDPTVVPVDVVEALGNKFGTVTNNKGFRVLPPCVRVIQGDGINERSIETILENLKNRGYSAENIAFGMGGELLQTPNRDTLKFAMKCSAIKLNGFWEGVSKNPVTDPGKKSKGGRLGLVKDDGKYMTVQEHEANGHNLLETVWKNGKLLRIQTFSEIRALSNS